MTDNQDSKIGDAVQPPTDRPLTAGDVPLLREGDVLVYTGLTTLETFLGLVPDGEAYAGELRVKDENGMCSINHAHCFTFVSRPATSAASEGEGVERTIGGESVLGFKVAAWRFDTRCPQDQDKEKWDSFFGKSGPPHTYCEHWSTPGAGASNVERLFTETQLRAALASPSASERERELEGALGLISDGWDVIESSGSMGEMTLQAPDDWEGDQNEILVKFHGLTAQPAGEGK